MSELEGLILPQKEDRLRGSGEFPATISQRGLPRIIGLAGKMGAGKDTVAAMLRMVGYGKITFGEELRIEVMEAIATRETPEGMPDDLAPLIHLGVLNRSSIYNKPTTSSVRRLLQWWGTEYRRGQDEDYWVKRVASRMGAQGQYSIPDVRFENEARFIKENGGVVFLVKGRTSSNRNAEHASEQLSGVVPDAVLDNGPNVDMFALAEQVAKLLGEYGN